MRVTTTSNEPSANGRCSAGADDVGLHAGRRVARDDLAPRLAQAPRDVAAAGGDVERRLAGARVAHLDDEVEVGVRRRASATSR